MPCHHLIEREHAALARALGIGESNRGRSELGGVRATAVARHPVAGRAGLSEQCIAGDEVRSLIGRERHRVGAQQIGREPVRQCCHRFSRSLFRDHRLEVGSPLDEGLTLRLRWQALKPCRDRRGELRHLGIFRRALDPTVGDRAAIIDGHIVEQPPCGLHVAGFGDCRSRDQQRRERGEQPQREHCPDQREQTHYRSPNSRRAPVTIS